MIVRTTAQITGTDRQVDSDHWTSKRIILADDEVGFSYHETTVAAGIETPLHSTPLHSTTRTTSRRCG